MTFWKNDDEEDEALGGRVVEFTDSLSDKGFLLKTLGILIAANVLIWVAAVTVAEHIVGFLDFLGQFGDKARLLPLAVPFGSGLWLVYSLIRLWQPDLEDQKLLESDVMGSMSYGTEANRRYFSWIAAILAGLLNAVGFGLIVDLLSSSGLHLLG